MSKAVMISVNPKMCEKIVSGEKTVLVKKTKPKLESPFKGYIYCTQSKDMLWVLRNDERNCEKFAAIFTAKDVGGATKANGKVIGEFVCNYMTSFKAMGEVQALYNETKETCISHDEIIEYAKGKRLYYWHISDLKIYDEPKELSEFFLACNKPKGTDCSICLDRKENRCKSLNRPPQGWCYVEEVAAQ